MSKRFTESEVSQIVKQALEEQQKEFEKERRLCDIEEAITQLRVDVDNLIANSKKAGF